MNNKDYKITDRMKLYYDYLEVLENLSNEILKKRFWKKYSVSDQVQIIKEVREARYQFWESIYTDYPELRNKVVKIKNNKFFIKERRDSSL